MLADNTNLPKIITPKEVGEYLRIGNTKLYQLIKRKDFPSFKLGGSYFVLEDKFIEWMDVQTRKLKFKL